MSNSRAEACARPRSRRDNAVTLHLVAEAKPGISRFTACKPKPAIPNRIISTPIAQHIVKKFADTGKLFPNRDSKELSTRPATVSLAYRPGGHLSLQNAAQRLHLADRNGCRRPG